MENIIRMSIATEYILYLYSHDKEGICYSSRHSHVSARIFNCQELMLSGVTKNT